ncbi:hypothetical protein ACI2KR_07435 [Pseudomonas luteola]
MTTATVFELTARQSNTAYTELSATLKVVNWAIQVQTILRAAGLPSMELAEVKDTPIPAGSNAHAFGHSTIGAFLTTAKDQLGLDRDWNEWVLHAKAFRFQNTYNIYSDNPKEIIAQVDDVAKTLGRLPFTSSEYHQQKDLIFNQQRRDSETRHQAQNRELGERVSDLMHRLDKEKSLSEELKIRAMETQSKLELAMRDMDQKLAEARLQHNSELERRLTEQKSTIETAFLKEMDDLRKQADMRVREAQERLDEMKAHYEQNTVSKKDHEVVCLQLNRAREENFELIRSMNEVTARLDQTNAELETERLSHAQAKEQIAALSSDVERLTNRMNTIVRTPFVGSGDEIVSELQHQIDDLIAKTETMSLETSELRRKKEAIERKLGLYKERLNELSENNKSLKAKFKSANTSLNIKIAEMSAMKKNVWVLGVALTISVGTCVVLMIA